MSKRIKINYDKLRVGDMVVCGGRGPTAMIIKAATVGRKAVFDKKVSCHTGMVVKWGGQFFIAEMLASGLCISPFSRYEKAKDRRFILDIKRSPVYSSPAKRKALQARVALDYRHSIEYDWKGDINFVIKRVKNSKGRYYCSEHYQYQTKKDGVPYPGRFDIRVSPHDLQECVVFSSVNGWNG